MSPHNTTLPNSSALVIAASHNDLGAFCISSNIICSCAGTEMPLVLSIGNASTFYLFSSDISYIERGSTSRPRGRGDRQLLLTSTRQPQGPQATTSVRHSLARNKRVLQWIPLLWRSSSGGRWTPSRVQNPNQSFKKCTRSSDSLLPSCKL